MQKNKFGKLGAVAAIAAASLVASVFYGASGSTAATKTTIGIAYDLGGRSQPGFNQLAYIGVAPYLKANKKVKLIEAQASLSDTDDTRAERLRLMVKAGANPITAVGFLYASALTKVAKEFPNVKFGIVDDGSVAAPNVEGILFKEQEGSFLVGVIAALNTQTGKIGYIGGVKIPLLQKFEAGYVAGAMAINPKIKIQVTYVSLPPDFSGFNDPAKGYEAALGMYQNGADIVYAAAGGSGAGAHRAAFELGKHSIGVDADEALYPSNSKWKSAILTSMLKRVDVGVLDFVTSVINKKFKAGNKTFGLSNDGVGYSTTGGQISVAEKITVDRFKADIISGKIKVPEVPAGA